MDGLVFLLFLYLSIFPFGKLLGLLPDLIVLTISFYALIKKNKFTLNNFLIICIFSLFFSLSFFKIPQVLSGALYLIRLISYVFLSQIIAKKYKRKRELIINSLIVVGIFIAIFGWLQYLFLPDLRGLKDIGWDDHYYRLVSTFLDPAFTGILLVLTEILVTIKTINKKSKLKYLLNFFLLISILFTYSRATFLALIISLLFLLIKFKKQFITTFLILFIISVPLLPKTSGGEGVNLKRTYSITSRLINYKSGITLIKKSPIFGIGFNNVCVAKKSIEKNQGLHSCSGLDNSILFIFATTGLIGLIVFLQLIFSIIKNTKLDYRGWGLITSFLAIFIHSLFSNTIFYNFVLGWIAILIGVTRNNIKD